MSRKGRRAAPPAIHGPTPSSWTRSAGYKAMMVVLGEAEAYIHAGGQYEWDTAAPAAVAEAAGLHVSRIDGSRLSFNQEKPWLPDLLICDRSLAEKILELIRRFSG